MVAPRAEDWGIAPALYPFQGCLHRLSSGHQMHYLDEGKGDLVVMLHGNPSWSFYYRNLVLALKDSYRCIVPDHIGCGLSDKPGDDAYPYRLENRVQDLESLLNAVAPQGKMTLVVHDWGGMIGMTYAARNPERIARLVITNTSAFRLPTEKPFPWALALCRAPLLGKAMIQGGNAFAAIAANVCCQRNKMPKAVKKAYTAPYNSWGNRIATHRFVVDIPLKSGDYSYNMVLETEKAAPTFAELPTLVVWGLRDFVFDRHFLNEWQTHFPKATYQVYEDAGHYILEDVPETVGQVAAWLKNQK